MISINSEGMAMTKKFKVTDYIVQRLSQEGVEVVFGVSGGAALHLLHSVKVKKGIKLVTTHHEQAAAMAADSVARITNKIGVAIATSGPGATNLITGIAGCFYDSVPVIFITGQVSTTRLSGDSGVRQLGFQETPIVEMVKLITKYATQIKKPEEIVLELDKCIKIALSGRKGPTLIDIPDDIQRMEVEVPDETSDDFLGKKPIFSLTKIKDSDWSTLLKLISESQRPIIVVGWGVHLANREDVVRDFLDKLKWPVVLTWGAADLLDSEKSYRVGTFGTHGVRAANFAVQNADLVLSIGSRLDTKSTGSPAKSFAREAKKIMIDIDEKEIHKFKNLELNINLSLNLDIAGDEFRVLLRNIEAVANPISHYWNSKISRYKSELSRQPLQQKSTNIDPYEFVEVISNSCESKTRIILDTGCTVAWVLQDWVFKAQQRIFHDFNNTAMGWALPAAIGSISIKDDYKTIAIIGDGSFMMSIQELSTLKATGKKLKIFLLNNSGYSMIKQTQDQWFNSDYFASAANSEMVFPNFEIICEAFGIKYKRIEKQKDLPAGISQVLNDGESILCEIIISEDARVDPQVKFGSPIEGMDPPIKNELFESLMIIDKD
jgi:acetolactate synthase-1/2/3 large subunit